MSERMRVAFVCVHNSCRSQIAEALGNRLAGDVLECHSAGTQTANGINADAVRLVKVLHGIDMQELGQHPKGLDEIPEVDIVITMGCNVECPNLPCRHREDWGIDDPADKGDEQFIVAIAEIARKLIDLKSRIESGLLG